MNPTLATAAEKLMDEFPDEPTITVIPVLTDCADEFSDSDLMLSSRRHVPG